MDSGKMVLTGAIGLILIGALWVGSLFSGMGIGFGFGPGAGQGTGSAANTTETTPIATTEPTTATKSASFLISGNQIYMLLGNNPDVREKVTATRVLEYAKEHQLEVIEVKIAPDAQIGTQQELKKTLDAENIVLQEDYQEE